MKTEDTVLQLAVDLESTALSSRTRRKKVVGVAWNELSQSFFEINLYIPAHIALATQYSERAQRRYST